MKIIVVEGKRYLVLRELPPENENVEE